ncbi:RT0821/Lpp0805 family surface protein [Hansschlegelia plantiphila]|uniref:Surface antigen domain-containing protein n=1 Tax=Hansschlegelia plantiphila TaxID=374655 RepID=A0A9W6J1N7_9HYPH|nr:RT0821/Lpp0805 family surface protein [Hansschlegelia plantiphila]GLK68151.1 hypothetical protein GCM10008179_17890 [Hansschlegelia plantiphila]
MTGPRARLVRAAAAASLALAASGCSVSYPLFGADKDDIKTGSIDPRPAPAHAVVAKRDEIVSTPLAPPPGSAAPAAQPGAATPAAYSPDARQDTAALTPSDWAYARGALSIAMGAEATNASVPWANPDSGTYGSFSAVAGATSENGATCRAFAATHSAAGQEKRLEGTACRTAAGYWEAVAVRTTASRTL